MLCQECGKHNATVHFTKIVNGNVTELHLCEECAKKYKDFNFDNSFSFHKFLTGLLDNVQEDSLKDEHYNGLKCDTCGTSYYQFKQTGKLGCSNCYECFKTKLIPLLKEVHGHQEHTGKIPKRAGGLIGVKKEIKKLKKDLNILVENEEFEKAAVVRDKIKELEKKLANK